MAIVGLEGMTRAELEADIERGGKFVVFRYCISLVAVTIVKSSPVYYIRAKKPADPDGPRRSFLSRLLAWDPSKSRLLLLKGLPYTLITLVLGWWGIPRGLIETPVTILTNLGGGQDVTDAIRARVMPEYS